MLGELIFKSMDDTKLIEQIESIQNILVSYATGGAPFNEKYKELRRDIIAVEKINKAIPKFLFTCRDLDQFWAFIKKFNTYAERREFIWGGFGEILTSLESVGTYPSDQTTDCALKSLNLDYIRSEWSKALERRNSDPEAAITSARTFLEAVCRHVLDKKKVEYQEDADLPKLYGLAAKSLNLSPSQHTEQIFKEILSGCISVVKGLGALRNKLSDAHGKGTNHIKPSKRHAELAVNLAGAMSTFFLETLEFYNKKPGNGSI